MADFFQRSLIVHEQLRGKIGVCGKMPVENRDDLPLALPGIFRGALDACAPHITDAMNVAAAHALARATDNLRADHVLPDPLDRSLARLVEPPRPAPHLARLRVPAVPANRKRRGPVETAWSCGNGRGG